MKTERAVPSFDQYGGRIDQGELPSQRSNQQEGTRDFDSMGRIARPARTSPIGFASGQPTYVRHEGFGHGGFDH